MKQKLSGNLLFIIAASLILGASIAVAAPGRPMSDEWLAGRIQGALSYNTYLDSSDLSVDVKDGNAILTGTVSSDTERELGQQITSSIDGVSSVDNRITVDPDVAMRARPEWVQHAVDATTTAAVKSRLLANKNMHDMNIQITTKDGVVALTGTVSSLPQKESAEKIAFNTRDVRDVRNDLKIADAKSVGEKLNNASESVSREVSDSWISSKIRSSLLFSSDFPGSSVSVSTNKGTVTLEGSARSSNQRSDIESMVNDFVGVRAVNNRLNVRQG